MGREEALMGGSQRYEPPRSTEEIRREVEESLRRAQLDSEVNNLLTSELAEVNARDVELVNERLDEIKESLGDKVQGFDRLLFGGSVAKHTYVDGLSDIDSLVVLDAGAVEGEDPADLRSVLARVLEGRLNKGEVDDIRIGDLAVTVVYKDGQEIQLLPAVERGGKLAISSSDGTTWSSIDPAAFRERLSAVNQAQGGQVVPAIKLAKVVIANRPESERLGGYHVEALAVEAFRNYEGPRTHKAMLTHFFKAARERVLRPITDVTGQSSSIDEKYGAANSPERQRLSAALEGIGRRMEQAGASDEWRRLIGSAD
jgi:hypothetical protein